MPRGNNAIAIPPAVRQKALLADARWWLEDLPSLVSELERAWSITVGAPFPGATEALVAPAVTEEGSDVVVKLVVPGSVEATRREIEVLRLVDGDGCASLLRHDADRGALLMERLGASLREMALPIGRRHEILCAAAERCT